VQIEKGTLRRSYFLVPKAFNKKQDLQNPNKPSVQIEKGTLKRSYFLFPQAPKSKAFGAFGNKK
jgi:hypothetical protein